MSCPKPQEMLYTNLVQWLQQQQQQQPLALLLSIILFALLLLFTIHGRPNSNLPPSPPRLPIIGNLHQMSALPHRSLLSLSRKHGPIMLLRMGQVPTLVVSSPELAREVLRTHDHVFASRPKYKAAQLTMYGQKNVSFAQYGEYWRKVKKICVAHLLSSKTVQSFRQLREEEVARMIGKIRNLAATRDSGRVFEPVPVDLSEIFYEFANNNVIRATTGAPLREKKTMTRFKELVDELTAMIGAFQVDDMFPSLGWIGRFTGMNSRLGKVFVKWDEFLTALVDGHNDGNGDFIDVLLSLQKDSTAAGGMELTKDDIKALVMDMNGAGTETTHAVLVWAMSELIRHPDTMAKAKEEIRQHISVGKPMVTEDDIDKLVYLKAVIKEVLRLHLPVPLLLPHESIEETTLMGYKIPKNTRIIVNAWAIARDPKCWESPEEFVPERFIGESVADYKGRDFRFLPFGSGRRICPGMQFATVAIKVVLANLLHHFGWSLPNGRRGEELDIDEAPGITIRRARPLCAVATPC